MSDSTKTPETEFPPSTPRTKVAEESPGVASSKRVGGLALIGAGGGLLLAIGIVAMFRTVADPDTALAAGKALVITGAGILVGTVLEGAGQAINRRVVSRAYPPREMPAEES